MTPEKDHMWRGVLFGIVFPVLGAFTFYYIFMGFGNENQSGSLSAAFRMRTSALLGIACNLLVLNYFRRRYMNNAIRGLVVTTLVLAVIWALYFTTQFFQ